MPEDDLPQDIHLGNVAPAICKKLNVPGCVVLTLNENGTIGMTGHGVNHAKANELLSVGIHINLGQMENAIAAGAAGEEAQEMELRLRSERRGEVLQ
ncbi:hypothetical protein [Ralstonia holmesii]|uniref:hypothetical protein n=1 Tax=Ralstonia holmesii TaxID=3058602 RepID=UPI0028F5C91C|nr:hypothetical protein [Ralstonia sp. LMG 32967]CAJ0705873.1 hypothetical protein R11007_04712 [Ralstonia sp. LMG 32967]